MSRSEIFAEYFKLEDQLEALAHSLGTNGKKLTCDYDSQPESVKESLRPILWQQLEYLTTIRSWHYANLKNVSVFPIARLREF